MCLYISGLVYEIYSWAGSSIYMYSLVSYYMTSAPYVRRVFFFLHFLALMLMTWNASEIKTSFTLKVFISALQTLVVIRLLPI